MPPGLLTIAVHSKRNGVTSFTSAETIPSQYKGVSSCNSYTYSRCHLDTSVAWRYKNRSAIWSWSFSYNTKTVDYSVQIRLNRHRESNKQKRSAGRTLQNGRNTLLTAAGMPGRGRAALPLSKHLHTVTGLVQLATKSWVKISTKVE